MAAGDVGWGASSIFGCSGVSTRGFGERRFARARALSISTGAAVCTVELLSSSLVLNHSRIVAANPADRVDMWLVTCEIPSLEHLATTSLDVTPSSLAIW